MELIRQDLERIGGELRSAMGANYAEFERRLEVLLRELDDDPTRPAAREVRALIEEYLAPDVARRILAGTVTLRHGGFGFEPEPRTGATPVIPSPAEPVATARPEYEAERAEPAPLEPEPALRPPPAAAGRRGWFRPDLLFGRPRRRDIRLDLPEGPGVEMAGTETTYVTVPVWYATDRKHLPWEPPRRRFGPT
jgi:hypothetical protein